MPNALLRRSPGRLSGRYPTRSDPSGGRPLLHALGLVLVACSMLVLVLLVTGRLHGLLESSSCASGKMLRSRECETGEAGWTVVQLDGVLFLVGAIMAAAAKPTSAGHALVGKSSATERKAEQLKRR